MTTAASKSSYGAVEADDNAAVDRTFDAESTYYLPSSNGAPLSFRQRTRKLLNVWVPILLAVFIMGGFAWYLLRDFNNLYPGRGGGSPDGGTVVLPTGKKSLDDSKAQSISRGPSDASTTASGKRLESSNASCAAHSACQKLELIGNCCPTDKGVVLECC
ncbi:hypothetical protein MPSEU_000645900 [Mayamaea pseudoterrestris]|nr:hypothetical protein MPSEU_000645900 [Mayamaea pseudoterrestris]